MAFIRLVILGFLALSVIYVSVAIYSRSVRTEKLEKSWTEENSDSTDMTARDAFVRKGILAYNASFRPKLIGLIYVIPTVIVIAIVYITNTN